MPSASTATEKDSNDKIVVRCGPVRRLLIRPDTYEGALKLVSEAFLLPQKMPQIAFSAKLGGSGAMTRDARQDDFTAISENNWACLRDQVKVLRVVKVNQPNFEEPATKTATGHRTIKVVHESYHQTYKIKASSPLQDVFRTFSASVAIPLDDLKFYYEARALEPSDTPTSLNLPQTTTLSAMRYYVTFNLHYDHPKSIPVRVKHSAPIRKSETTETSPRTRGP